VEALEQFDGDFMFGGRHEVTAVLRRPDQFVAILAGTCRCELVDHERRSRHRTAAATLESANVSAPADSDRVPCKAIRRRRKSISATRSAAASPHRRPISTGSGEGIERVAR